MPLELVAFDIETTGFTVDDEVTAAGFAVPLGTRVFCQAHGEGAADVADAVQQEFETPVQVSMHTSEAALLEAMEVFVADRPRDDDVLIVAYNGERFRGGFDLPFLWTRLVAADVR